MFISNTKISIGSPRKSQWRHKAFLRGGSMLVVDNQNKVTLPGLLPIC